MKKTFKIILLLCLAIAANKLSAQTTFQNPVIRGMNPDPSICRVGDDFYLVTSTFEYFPGLPIYHSRDLVNWELIGHALSRNSNCPLMGCESGYGGNYAPTLRYNNGTFYVACTNYGGQGSQGQFYVTAEDPAGPWSEPVWVGNWYVDPSMTFVNDTLYYLTPNNDDGFLLGIMNPSTGKYTRPLEKIALGTGGAAPEGPHLYKINGFYYLMSAEGGTGYQHMEVIQRSASPWGPYTVSPVNPVLSNKDVPAHPFQAIGHADLVQLPDGSWWTVCLGYRPKGGNYHHLGRETFLAPITWNEDGWPKVGSDGIVQEEFPLPNLPEVQWAADPARDDFDGEKLELAWNFIRNPHNADWTLTGRPGFLRLNGSAISFREKDSPAFIGRRQSAFNMLASVKIDFTPGSPSEEAGLVVRGNDQNHFDLLLTRLGSKKVVMLRKHIQGLVVSLDYKEVEEGELTLRVSSSDLYYSFWVQEEGKTAVLIDSVETKILSTEKIGGFTGTYIGMYASGNGTANSNPADFDWFEYEEDPATPFEWATGQDESLNGMTTPGIVSTESPSFTEAVVKWGNIDNESYFIIERLGESGFDSIGISYENDTVFTDTGLEGNTLYLYQVRAKNENGYSLPSIARSVLTLPEPGPYHGTPSQIPGKIEAEDYDIGQQNEAYYDNDEGNNSGAYRNDDVDIETASDTPAGYNISWTGTGEWLTYTVDVNDTLVDIEFRVAVEYGGTIKLELDGTEIARKNLPLTGGWQVWETVTVPNVSLETGMGKILKMTFLGAGFNLNWINFVKVLPGEVKETYAQEICIYPNPASDYFQLTAEKNEISGIEIFSLTGDKIRSIQPGANSKIDISSLSPGMYIVKINSGLEKSRNVKLIKN